MSNCFVFSNPDNRPAKHGWCTGWYSNKCKCCGDLYVGAKRSYHCSDCAYNFDDQLQYEQLWRESGWYETAKYITKQFNKPKSQDG